MKTPASSIFGKDSGSYDSKLRALIKNIEGIEQIEIGSSSRSVTFRKNEMVLYKYQNERVKENCDPILVVYSLVNRPEIADLSNDRSLIRELCGLGFPVYLIDWGDPGSSDSEIELSTYIIDYLGSAVDHIRSDVSKKSVHILGLCQGGTFAVCYASLFPQKISSLITTASPINFHSDKDRLGALIRHLDLELFNNFSKTVDGRLLNFLFLFLKPYKLLQKKYFDLFENGHDISYVEDFLKMEKWIFDSPAISSKAFQEFAFYFYKENALVENTLVLNGRLVEPKNIIAPILNIYAREDHIVPPESSRALAGLISNPEYKEVELNCGHVGLYVGKSAGISTGTIIGNWIKTL